MMDRTFYQDLAEKGMKKERLSQGLCETILTSPDIELLPLLDAAFQVRKKFAGLKVKIHILNNAQNGHCPEDCHYCAQAKSSEAAIEEYPLKNDDEILAEAREAYLSGAFRYCMVFAGRGPSKERVVRLASLIRKIKAKYPIEVCVSAGLLDREKATLLKEAGLDRLNHNLNTSERHYPKICTTHTYEDRLSTLRAARQAGLEVCSGMIVGMGESPEEVITVAVRLREVEARSIPVNFLIPIKGNVLAQPHNLTPEYCLRVLCLFRFLNPDAEIRVAAGREYHLRHLEVLCLYPADSLFLEGYLNVQGAESLRVLQMIKDAGFEIQSDRPLDEIFQRAKGLSVDNRLVLR
ncbi:MAG: biotin synthase BioB [Deltaproteobacteria bacterium RIFCSPLOWO2_12_FULL_50_11]|nr:MAG: biotin synthase BioB [Deltaproteobacteria bacterium RIFCSPLOWO2_12_FULL_50_11]